MLKDEIGKEKKRKLKTKKKFSICFWRTRILLMFFLIVKKNLNCVRVDPI